MSAIHCRNVYSPDPGATNRAAYIGLFLLREFLLAGKWQEMDKDSDTGWTSASNLLLSLSDFAVSSSDQLIVTSSTGGFVAATHERMILSLFASNDENRGLYNVAKVINTNTLLIDPRCRGEYWTTESGITGRIHNAGISDLLNNSSYLVMRAPSASGRPLEVRFTILNGATGYIQSLPKGDWFNPPGVPPVAGARTTTAVSTMDYGANSREMRWQAYFSDVADPLCSFVACWSDLYDVYASYMFGELDNVATGDSYPGYSHAAGVTSLPMFWHLHGFRMLDEFDATTVFRPTYYKDAIATAETGRRDDREETRVQRGRIKLYQPTIIGDPGSGVGYVRGNHPFSCLNERWTDYESRGNRWVFGSVALPKNGDNDPKILASSSW